MIKEFMQREDFLKEIEKLEFEIILLKEGLIPIGELNEFIELEDYRKLKSETHTDIQKVWMYDSSFPLNNVNMEERGKLIERVFFKVAQEWI